MARNKQVTVDPYVARMERPRGEPGPLHRTGVSETGTANGPRVLTRSCGHTVTTRGPAGSSTLAFLSCQDSSEIS